MTKKIYIDLDGTVIDIKNRHYTVYQECITDLGGLAIEQNIYWSLKRRNSDIATLLSLSNIKKSDTTSFQKLFSIHIEQQQYLLLDTLFPQSLALLSHLSNHYTLNLITLRQSRQELTRQLETLHIDRYFQKVLSLSNSSASLSGKSSLFDTEKLTSDDVLIGDTEEDITTGKAVHLKTIGVTWGIRSEEFLKLYYPDFLCPDMQSVYDLL